MKKFLKILVSVIIAGMLLVAGAGLFFSSGLKEGQNIELAGVDISTLDDGTYSGQFKNGRWSNKVSVSVRDQMIQDIELVDDMLVADPKVTQAIFDRVLEKQNTDVDVVTGATVTSKAYLKSIENALTTK